MASQKESTQKRAVLHRNAGFYTVAMRNYTRRNERAVLREKLRIFSFAQRLYETFVLLNIFSRLHPTDTLESAATVSRAVAQGPGANFGKRGTYYLASPGISLIIGQRNTLKFVRNYT